MQYNIGARCSQNRRAIGTHQHAAALGTNQFTEIVADLIWINIDSANDI
jgi:hypothetical protein